MGKNGSNDMLQLKDIEFSYSNAKKERFSILQGLNLTVPQGEVMALVGGNGVGKTTLFNIISGQQKDFRGKVIFEGHDISRLPAHDVSLLGIGRLFQGRQLMDDLSLLDNFKIASFDKTGEFPFSYLFFSAKIKKAEQLKEAQTREIIADVFGRDCKYIKMLEAKGGEFSYGEQRMLAIARLLMGKNKLLLLDEPTSGVNPVYNKQFGRIIRQLVEEQGMTVLLIEHNMHFVRSVADSCAFLSDGKIAAIGRTEEVLNDQFVRNSYLGL